MEFGDFINSLPRIPGTASEVKATAEFRRIRDAVWSDWREAPDLDGGTAKLSAWLRVPGGTRSLRPAQAAALRALYDRAGCFAPLRTGAGKTDVSLVAPEVCDAKRPLLFVPASLRDKTNREAYQLAKNYRQRPIRIVSYEALSLAKNAESLFTWAPDLIICDEAHYLKDSSGPRWSRIKRYTDAQQKAGNLVRRMVMSGSITSRSLRDYWHLIRWCLGAGAPLPSSLEEFTLWCFALDEKVPDGARVEPGALLQIAPEDPADGTGIDAARARYGRRLLATAGVVSSGGDIPQVGLNARIVTLAPSEPIARAATHLRSTWETPCGLPFETAMDLWRHEREVSCGLYYRWKHQPPAEWLGARKMWSAYVRDILSRSRTLDTPMQVAKAVHDGKLPDGVGPLTEWQRVAPSFEPETEAVWICDTTLRYAADWLAKEKGICWVHHSAFGRALAAATGVPYFAAQGQANGVAIDQHRGPAIASIQSCSRGFNLQFHRTNLVVTTPTTASANEQMISRTHRDGQEADDVEVTYLQRLEGDARALDQARADAEYVAATMRSPQRLTIATWMT